MTKEDDKNSSLFNLDNLLYGRLLAKVNSEITFT